MVWIDVIISVVLAFVSRYRIMSRIFPFRRIARNWVEKQFSFKSAEVEAIYPVKDDVLTGEPYISVKKSYDNRSPVRVAVKQMLVRAYVDRALTVILTYDSGEKEHYFASGYREFSSYPENGAFPPGEGVVRFQAHIPTYFLARKEIDLYVGLFGYVNCSSPFGNFRKMITDEIHVGRKQLSPPVLET